MSHAFNGMASLGEHCAYVDPKYRLATFKDWIYDSEPAARCTSENLAKAGFISAVTPDDPYAASCAFCLKTLQWDAQDDPKQEHKLHCPKCLFVTTALEVPSDELTTEDAIRLIFHRYGNISCTAFRELHTQGALFEENITSQVEKLTKNL
ncbi:hypothetical protein QR680_005236 [Steinernema hermaphroditum]|uniref:Uncharacterized protein n=1 Tax=Steinernema hermaphroditum TaxID=289476 RepID=A0AA39HR99_9BILA|nr:hypothetical protein QR680_005236 [Steinernema hermaphroditum]